MRLLAALTLVVASALALAQDKPQEPVEESVKPPPIENTEDAARCQKLEGELRERCLRDVGAATGASMPPKPAPPSAVQRDPVTEPPPQNPRQPR